MMFHFHSADDGVFFHSSGREQRGETPRYRD